MADTLLTSTIVTREALRILHEKLSFIGTINHEYSKEYATTGAKIGSSLKIRKPNRYTIRNGASMSIQDVTETSETLVMATQKGVDLDFTSVDLTLKLDDFSKRIIQPAMAVLATNIEKDVFNVYKEVYNLVGTPGTTPSTLKVFLDARTKLNQFVAPKDTNRCVQIDSVAGGATIDTLKGLFHSSEQIAEQYREGMMGRIAGFNFYENDVVPVHTNLLQAGTPLVNGASQTGASLITDGWTANTTIAQGTVFTLAAVHAVHPETRVAYPFLQQFVVTADATADGTGNATLSISPSITTSGATQTVNASPADNAALTLVGSASTAYTQHLAYHRDAFAFVSADLEMPQNRDFSARVVYDGISMRIVKDYAITTDTFPCRVDVLYGYKCIRPELAVRIIG